jgi:hypothetical protein
MKHNKHLPLQQPPAVPAPARSVANSELSAEEKYFAPSVDEVARRAYFSYENHGSLPGHEVQHWLKAEADLIAERNLTRVHGFHRQP